MAWFRSFRGVRKRWGGAGVGAGLALLSQLVGCSSSQGNLGNCASQCGDLCKALTDCDVEVPSDCVSQCTKGVTGADCSDARPPDQLTCAELKEAYACADYCATLCTRAPSCGAFDSKLCAQGCTTSSPSICNPASVAARTCDQLKPELRDYEDRARLEQRGGDFATIGGTINAYGLCTGAGDCELPLGCTLSTNTCSTCESDADCDRGFGLYICSAEQECLKVSCSSDTDCSGEVCDAALHECVECREEADCSGYYKACDSENAKCVECTADAHCVHAYAPRCEIASNHCRECLTNADCVDQPNSPRCDTTTNNCTRCEEDADCAGSALGPVCVRSQCSACRVDADCKDPATPVCYGLRNTCVECNGPEQCPDTNCDLTNHVCWQLLP